MSNEKAVQHSWVPNVLSDSGGKVCRNCGVVSECSEIACKRHPTFRGIPGFPADDEKAPIPFETFKGAICKGSFLLGSACGRCEKCQWERTQMKATDSLDLLSFALHGRKAAPRDFICGSDAAILKDAAERIAALQAEVDALKENLRLSRDNENLLRYERNSLRKQIETEKDLAAENDALKDEVARLSAPVSDAEWYGHTYWQEDGGMRSFLNCFILARATPPQDGGKE